MKMTEKFIEARGVFEEGQYTMTIAESLQGNGDAGELVLSKEVSVCPLIDGCQVWGVYRLIFSFDFRGEIAGISSYLNPPEGYEAVPLKEEAAAKKLLEGGQYFTDNAEPLYRVEISEVSLVYYSDSNPEEAGFLLYPVYVFYGTGNPSNSEEQVSFAAAVDAIAG